MKGGRRRAQVVRGLGKSRLRARKRLSVGCATFFTAHVGRGVRLGGGFAFGCHSIKIAAVRFALDRVENADIARDFHQRRRSCGA